MVPEDREERIRKRAYEIWEREGRPHGRDAEHWGQATSEIDAEVAASGLETKSAEPAEPEASPADRRRAVRRPVEQARQSTENSRQKAELRNVSEER
jgi:Protein of unknown function (DUF2934)